MCQSRRRWLLAFNESHTRIHDRQFIGSRVQLKAIMGKRTLADLSRNDQIEVKSMDGLD